MHLGPWEIVAILGVIMVVVMIVGPKKLPALGKSLAEFVKNLKSGIKDDKK